MPKGVRKTTAKTTVTVPIEFPNREVKKAFDAYCLLIGKSRPDAVVEALLDSLATHDELSGVPCFRALYDYRRLGGPAEVWDHPTLVMGEGKTKEAKDTQGS